MSIRLAKLYLFSVQPPDKYSTRPNLKWVRTQGCSLYASGKIQKYFLNIWYIWTSHGSDLPVRYSLCKISLLIMYCFYCQGQNHHHYQICFLVSQKDVQPILQQNMAVSKFQCHCNTDCIGRTIQRSKVHVWQHISRSICGRSQSLTSSLSQLHESAIHKHLCDYYLCYMYYSDEYFSALLQG